ncbi:topless-related protein 1-like [Malus sylvestris]|uniref:topless-related protein 1-like n=1 Tax=Malus sylvestris TaxID=3752 RepID=UPI0021ACCEEB|nr:topless-related protein 1-like [Malus sylvestris]
MNGVRSFHTPVTIICANYGLSGSAERNNFPSVNSSLNWQHQLCENPISNPHFETLYVDHSCGQPNRAWAPSPANNLLLGSLPKARGCLPLGAHEPFQPTPASVPIPLATVTHPAVNLAINLLPVTFPGHGHGQALDAPDDLPKNVTRTLNQGSSPMGMDFHPSQQTLLLVGTNVGDVGLWEVGSKGQLFLRNFIVWDLSSCSMLLQAALVKDPSVSVNRVVWSHDGALFGVAYSRHIVQIYSYHGGDDVREHLEIDAHIGGVNDLAFSHPNEQLCVITCGDDKTIKVWDATTGAKQWTFEGHEAPVYSVCPHYRENIQFILSTALDGKIKAWVYDNLGSRVDYYAPGRWCTTMVYSADGTRLFSCGTSKDGESYIVEWNETEMFVKRTYKGFRKRSFGVVQFNTIKNRFLAAGDDFSIKFWDMDNIQLLTTVDADGGLPACPRICLNKDGTLLAASANENGIKVLANADGMRLLRTIENHLSYDGSTTSEVVMETFNVQPLVIAAHPQEANQFALGLSDGSVYVFEPLESESKWGVAPPVENGSASSAPPTQVGAAGSDQAQR